MEIRPVDVHDDRALREVYDVQNRAELVGREGYPRWSWPAMRSQFQHDDPGERIRLLGGYEDGVLVGTCHAYLPLLDNREKAWVGVDVDPPHRRRGLGTRLAEAVRELAREEQRTVLVTETKLPAGERETHGHRRFAERCGYELASVEVARWQTLPTPEEELDRWARIAAERAGGYALETHVDQVPDELLPSLCRLMGQLSVDAPTGSVDYEEEAITPERHRANLAATVAGGRHVYETVALDADRQVVAQTTMAVPVDGARDGRTDAVQWGTFVDREHRGHRLGLAVKVANQRRVQADHPHLRRVVTQNSEVNDHMVAINVLMGFEAVEDSAELVLRL